MGRPTGWMRELTGRAPMRSPGRPPVRVASGSGGVLVGDRATGSRRRRPRELVGVSEPVGVRWFRDGGGMPDDHLAPLSGRYLSFAEREEIALLRAQGIGVRAIARGSVVAVDDLPGAAPQRGHAWRQARVPGVGRAVEGGAAGPASEDREARRRRRLREYVQERLSGRFAGRTGRRCRARRRAVEGSEQAAPSGPAVGEAWSPEQISNRLKSDFPDDESMRISHEAIYQALYIQGRGALKRELVACLRTGRALRVPRARVAAWQEVRDRRDHDQRAARRGRGPGRPGPLGGRSDPRDSATPRSARWWSARAASRCCCTSRHPRTVSHGSRTARRSPGTAAEQVRDAIAERSRRCPSSCAGPWPGTRARRWPSTPNCGSTPACRCTSATRRAHGSAAPTRTPTGCCASTSREAPIFTVTAPRTSRRSPRHSTAGHERHSAGGPPPRSSTSTSPSRGMTLTTARTRLSPLRHSLRSRLRDDSRVLRIPYSPLTYTLLRGPVEPELAALIGMVNQAAVGATSGKRHLERVDDEL